MQTLNLGILAHVDAGKTSLTERLLYAAGVIDEIGRVDDGSTQTDSLTLERQRGITIKSAVASFAIGDTAINLIDTPGHPDFIAEVERVLAVLDGVVLVVSAVEGVQAQTRVLMRTLRRLRLPTLVFVNKIDRAGARPEVVVDAIARRLARAIVPMGTVGAAGRRAAAFAPYADDDPRFTSVATEVLADHDEALLAALVDDTAVAPARLRSELAAQTAAARVHPVLFGSAITGAGVDALMDAIPRLLPAANTGAAAAADASASVFKVERGRGGERIAYVRMFAGALQVRDRVPLGRDGGAGKVTAIRVFEQGGLASADRLAAGQIGKVTGLHDVRIGDAIGIAPAHGTDAHVFAAPTLETVVAPVRQEDRGALHAALTELAEQDPLIGLRQDDVRGETSVSLYGEVQKEVIGATLAADFGVEVTFSETTTICIERPVGTGAAVELIGVDPNPFLATVGLRVEPGPPGSGVTFGLEVELGSLPYSFVRATEETLRTTLGQGLHGWEVTDCAVTLIRSGYWAKQSHGVRDFDPTMSSTAGDFRNLTPLVLMDALRQAGTEVLEPIHRFRLELPADTLGAVLPLLGRLRAVPDAPVVEGVECVVEGDVPAARIHELQQQLPAAARGEALLEPAFDRHEPMRGEVPSRPRTDHDPLNRKDYLLALTGRAAGPRSR